VASVVPEPELCFGAAAVSGPVTGVRLDIYDEDEHNNDSNNNRNDGSSGNNSSSGSGSSSSSGGCKNAALGSGDGSRSSGSGGGNELIGTALVQVPPWGSSLSTSSTSSTSPPPSMEGGDASASGSGSGGGSDATAAVVDLEDWYEVDSGGSVWARVVVELGRRVFEVTLDKNDKNSNSPRRHHQQQRKYQQEQDGDGLVSFVEGATGLLLRRRCGRYKACKPPEDEEEEEGDLYVTEVAVFAPGSSVSGLDVAGVADAEANAAAVPGRAGGVRPGDVVMAVQGQTTLGEWLG
jgi:hypothetical protein